MDKKQIKERLEKYDENQVNNYLVYLASLEKDKNARQWIGKVKDAELAQAFKKVNQDGLVIDGESVTLQFRGKLLISYNYQAYKNKVIVRYPETKFDIQLVHEGDSFNFNKASGSVIYNHTVADPFGDDKTIIGAYCIIKNDRGEFLETINQTEIRKMRAVAKTQSIWNTWEGEMIMKSVIKRACKRHFNDLVESIEKIDNENYDHSGVKIEVTEEIKKEIESFKDEMDLLEYANSNEMKFLVKSEEFQTLINDKRNELNSIES